MVDLPTQGLTQADLDRIDQAMVEMAVNGVAKTRFADGRELTFRSMEELVNARRLVAEVVKGSQRSGGIFGRASIGIYRRY
ncbi:hypothetical protein [Pseudoroseomonas cervicalis]|uniref:hypothetical protein n=1 Tax=Teichococcus cervicalis TaxID=204525 RepID=UPI0027855F26|nr:hypothetical protein [Pseudoroseomonas cervicalis]MDQ1079702.1 hypothetical protein [Pseudoroseomonas cervicalis]